MSIQFIVRQAFLLFTCLVLFLTVREARILSQASPTLAKEDPCASPTPSASATATPTPTPTPTPSPSPTPTPFPNQKIIFTEFMACPASGNEWLELFNTSDTDIQVSNWQMIDQANNKKYISGTLPAHEFAVFEWTGSLLNNTGDSFQIFTDLGQEIGSATYDECDTGISFVYEDGEWVGALESAGEETTVSENNVTEATSSAQAQLTNTTDTTDATQLADRTQTPTSQLNSNYLPRVPPKLTLDQNTPPSAEPANDDHTPAETSAPAFSTIWSAIIGGLLQLAPITMSAYDQYFKKIT